MSSQGLLSNLSVNRFESVKTKELENSSLLVLTEILNVLKHIDSDLHQLKDTVEHIDTDLHELNGTVKHIDTDVHELIGVNKDILITLQTNP